MTPNQNTIHCNLSATEVKPAYSTIYKSITPLIFGASVYMLTNMVDTTQPASVTPVASTPQLTTAPTAQNTGKRILVVDDEQYIRELYEEVLKAEGFQVDTASDGQEALEKILAGGYSAITLDVIMPKLDGLGILAQLKATPPKQKNGPIILLTSLANDPAVKQALENGAQKVIIKTDITPKQFVDTIKQMVG